jgi:pimeloyl-ACP methyl ester carboxylesterase
MAKPYSERLVYTACEDGVILAGLVIRPAARSARPTAVIWIPGMSINFYHPSAIPIGRELAGLGYAFISANQRGHDIGTHLWKKQKDAQEIVPTYGGALWERFEESPRDMAAWIDFTMNQGFQGVVLVGHSFGAKKVVYYQAYRQDPRVSGLVVASTKFTPPEVDPELVALAEQMVTDGRGEELLPWGTFQSFFIGASSAQTYLSRVPDLYGVSSPHPEIAQIRCPLLLCCGTNEGDDPTRSREIVQDHEMIAKKAVAAPRVDTAFFEGANHGYDSHEREVAGAIASWADTLR